MRHLGLGLISLLLVLSGCATAPPAQAPDNQVAPSFVPPAAGALIVLVPPPRSSVVDKGVDQVEGQLNAQLKAAGYRVATISRENHDKLWSQHAQAVGGVFDPATGAARPQAFAAALSTLARTICDEVNCQFVLMHRIVRRSAKLQGSQAEWDGVRQAIPIKNATGGDVRMSGNAPALSLQVIGLGGKGGFGFRRTAGLTLPFETNVREVRNDRRADLFADDADVTHAVGLVLEPLAKPRAAP